MVRSFYIVLSGKVSIYILNKDELEGMEDDGIFDNIIQYTDKGKLDREKLGYMVTHLGKESRRGSEVTFRIESSAMSRGYCTLVGQMLEETCNFCLHKSEGCPLTPLPLTYNFLSKFSNNRFKLWSVSLF